MRLPSSFGAVHHEVELGVVIGKTAANIAADGALDFVAGFTIVNDVTARELQKKDIAAGLPWFRAKSFDTFCPIGPYLMPRESVADPQNLHNELRVNGKIRQQATTARQEKSFDLHCAHLARVALVMKEDESLDPRDIGFSPSPLRFLNIL